MDDKTYLIFDLVCDYLKGKKTRANFRVVNREFKIISDNLFRRYYSMHLLNNVLVNRIGFDEFVVEDINYLGYKSILQLLIICCDSAYKDPLLNQCNILYIDPFDPTKNAHRNRLKILCRIRKRESLIFSMALDYAAKPRYIKQRNELDIP